MADMKFEEALKKLEKIVADLESGDLSLDDALQKYEEGVRLSRFCEKKLDAAKKKVEILVKAEDGSIGLEPFDERAAEGQTEAEPVKRKKKEKGGELF